MSTAHLTPPGDLPRDHDLTDDGVCACAPIFEYVRSPYDTLGGPAAWVFVHHNHAREEGK